MNLLALTTHRSAPQQPRPFGTCFHPSLGPATGDLNIHTSKASSQTAFRPPLNFTFNYCQDNSPVSATFCDCEGLKAPKEKKIVQELTLRSTTFAFLWEEAFKTRGGKMTIAHRAAGRGGAVALLKASGAQRHKELLPFLTRPEAGAAARSPPWERSAEGPSPRDLPRQPRRNPQLGMELLLGCPGPGGTSPPLSFSFFS